MGSVISHISPTGEDPPNTDIATAQHTSEDTHPIESPTKEEYVAAMARRKKASSRIAGSTQFPAASGTASAPQKTTNSNLITSKPIKDTFSATTNGSSEMSQVDQLDVEAEPSSSPSRQCPSPAISGEEIKEVAGPETHVVDGDILADSPSQTRSSSPTHGSGAAIYIDQSPSPKCNVDTRTTTPGTSPDVVKATDAKHSTDCHTNFIVIDGPEETDTNPQPKRTLAPAPTDIEGRVTWSRTSSASEKTQPKKGEGRLAAAFEQLLENRLETDRLQKLAEQDTATKKLLITEPAKLRRRAATYASGFLPLYCPQDLKLSLSLLHDEFMRENVREMVMLWAISPDEKWRLSKEYETVRCPDHFRRAIDKLRASVMDIALPGLLSFWCDRPKKVYFMSIQWFHQGKVDNPRWYGVEAELSKGEEVPENKESQEGVDKAGIEEDVANGEKTTNGEVVTAEKELMDIEVVTKTSTTKDMNGLNNGKEANKRVREELIAEDEPPAKRTRRRNGDN